MNVPKFKCGLKTPRHLKEALAFDKENDDAGWEDAAKKEIDSLISFKVFEFLTKGIRAPLQSRRILIWLMCEAKMDGRQKARMVAGGHVTPAPTEETHASVVKGESVKIIFLIAVMNGLDLLMGDTKNAFLNARTTEKVRMVCGLHHFHPLCLANYAPSHDLPICLDSLP